MILGFKCSSWLSAALCCHTLPVSLLTLSPGATWCIFNQGMSALTSSCHQNMLLYSCVENSHQYVKWWKLLQPQSHRSTNSCFLFHEYTVCVVVCILTRMEVRRMHFSGRHRTSCLLCDWGQFKCIYLSPCWLPRINLLLLTSVESSCQNNKKSFPPPLVLISQQTLTFSSTEMWSVFF